MKSVVEGCGVGAREEHFDSLCSDSVPLPWLEVLIDNFLGDHGSPEVDLQRLADKYPLTFHCVGMNLASVDKPCEMYLQSLRDLMERYSPAMISDHLSWVAYKNVEHHDLLPIPYTHESLDLIVRNISIVQESLGSSISIENPSRYLSFVASDYSEVDFLNEVSRKSGCQLLLDINNVYVSCTNSGEAPLDFLKSVRGEHVSQYHLAGFEDHGDVLVDTHSKAVTTQVWELYEWALRHLKIAPTLIEWDSEIPEFAVLKGEAKKAQSLWETIDAS